PFLKDSPDRRAIVPLEPTYPHPRGCRVVAEMDEDPLLSAYYFVESDGHYSGTEQELKSVALEYGRIQAALGQLPAEIDLGPIEKTRTEFRADKRIPEWYREIRANYLAAPRQYREDDTPFRLMQ